MGVRTKAGNSKLGVSEKLLLQHVDQGRIHEAVVIGDAQGHERVAGDFLRENLSLAVGMLALHAEDLVGLAEVAGGDPAPRTVLGAGAAGLVARVVLEEGLGSE